MKITALFGLLVVMLNSTIITLALDVTDHGHLVAALLARDIPEDTALELINLLPRHDPVTVTVTATVCNQVPYTTPPGTSTTEVPPSNPGQTISTTLTTTDTSFSTVTASVPGTVYTESSSFIASSTIPPSTGTVPSTGVLSTSNTVSSSSVSTAITSTTHSTTSTVTTHTTATSSFASVPPAVPGNAASNVHVNSGLWGLVALLAIA